MQLKKASLGPCPICDRDMPDDSAICDKHHFLPKCRGGVETQYVHRICHRKIHSLFTEKELEKDYHDPIRVRAHPEMAKFIAWVQKKLPEYNDHSITSNDKRRKKGKR